MQRTFFLTFDVEDYVSKNAVAELHRTLESLRNFDLTALFFITGNMAEKLSRFPSTIDLLDDHQIGYHSSGHSIHPRLFEFTDVESFEEAYQISLTRECSHVNPLTGGVEGPGGIKALRALFPKKIIKAFRAPGYCWTPPHLEALKTLEIVYDFSTTISQEPINYRGTTFYPFTLLTTWQGGIREQAYLQRLIMRHETGVLTIHPSSIVNKLDWDLVYYSNSRNSNGENLRLNPDALVPPPSRNPAEILSFHKKFDLLLRHLKSLEKLGFARITPDLRIAGRTLDPKSLDLFSIYEASMIWPKKYFKYYPKFLLQHFKSYFT